MRLAWSSISTICGGASSSASLACPTHGARRVPAGLISRQECPRQRLAIAAASSTAASAAGDDDNLQRLSELVEEVLKQQKAAGNRLASIEESLGRNNTQQAAHGNRLASMEESLGRNNSQLASVAKLLGTVVEDTVRSGRCLDGPAIWRSVEDIAAAVEAGKGADVATAALVQHVVKEDVLPAFTAYIAQRLQREFDAREQQLCKDVASQLLLLPRWQLEQLPPQAAALADEQALAQASAEAKQAEAKQAEAKQALVGELARWAGEAQAQGMAAELRELRALATDAAAHGQVAAEVRSVVGAAAAHARASAAAHGGVQQGAVDAGLPLDKVVGVLLGAIQTAKCGAWAHPFLDAAARHLRNRASGSPADAAAQLRVEPALGLMLFVYSACGELREEVEMSVVPRCQLLEAGQVLLQFAEVKPSSADVGAAKQQVKLGMDVMAKAWEVVHGPARFYKRATMYVKRREPRSPTAFEDGGIHFTVIRA